MMEWVPTQPTFNFSFGRVHSYIIHGRVAVGFTARWNFGLGGLMLILKLKLIRNFAWLLMMMGLFLDLSRVRGCCVGMRGSREGDSGGLCALFGGMDDIGDGKRRHHRLWSSRCVRFHVASSNSPKFMYHMFCIIYVFLYSDGIAVCATRRWLMEVYGPSGPHQAAPVGSDIHTCTRQPCTLIGVTAFFFFHPN